MNSFTDWDGELYHHGVPGQRKGVRRYQNPDGSYTELGRKHYGIGLRRRYQNPDGTFTKKGIKRVNRFMGAGYLNSSDWKQKKNIFGMPILGVKEINKRYNKQRKNVEKAFKTEYWKEVEKAGGYWRNMPIEVDKHLWDKYKTPYATAFLKDLKMDITPAAIRQIKKMIRQVDSQYDYPKFR